MSEQPEQIPAPDHQQHPDPSSSDNQVVVIGPDGQPIGTLPASVVAAAQARAGHDDAEDPSRMVDSPAKVMRIGSMIKQLLEEVRQAPLDEASRMRLKEIHDNSVQELCAGLSPDLREELERLALPFVDGEVPSESELRIAQAQLVGWLEGLFHGIQTALVAQQMAARAQLEQMRSGRALPPGMTLAQAGGDDQPAPGGGHGQYL